MLKHTMLKWVAAASLLALPAIPAVAAHVSRTHKTAAISLSATTPAAKPHKLAGKAPVTKKLSTKSHKSTKLSISAKKPTKLASAHKSTKKLSAKTTKKPSTFKAGPTYMAPPVM